MRRPMLLSVVALELLLTSFQTAQAQMPAGPSSAWRSGPQLVVPVLAWNQPRLQALRRYRPPDGRPPGGEGVPAPERGPTVGNLAAGGVLGGALGLALGGLAGATVDRGGQDGDAGVWFAVGVGVGETFGVAYGVHVAAGGRTPPRTRRASAAACAALTAAGLGLAAASRNGLPLLAVPVAQIITAVGIERRALRGRTRP